ncbi:FAD binding domain-containing protein [Mycolicibacterium grossiae]|uniref:Molybdopterin dehydrogenase n=1 Tax=Mycolicibacterium grossiae TaxID=1552759 RepID=A0A1E8PY07_9MYCO|nr:xanthine dehydrogenase family protein subunit M [Mycolicibacterium grossiae]OFJ51222.1 molybdopterin dehydrogenase [Mycolicibacterium grossiae]QEM46831.1 xanthine dehydrogenase family protein subunit M [Mycolicibacterium grossiae]
MKTFAFRHAESVEDAVETAARTGGRFYAGGTNLLDLMKNGVETPDVLIDVGRLGLDAIIATPAGGLLIGSGVTNSAVANHPLVRDGYPVLSQAILSGATTQLRNMATAGGNLLQRTRCPYFMDPAFAACDKRSPGSGCAARAGLNREHALFGSGGGCVAVHPSDMAVALAALDATVHVVGPAGARRLGWAEFFRLPGDHPERDVTLDAAELITGIELPASPFAEHGWYEKVRDRHSYAFALVSVAAGLDVVDGAIRSAAVALGGVAAMPWRVRAAEDELVGRRPERAAFVAAAHAALAGAEPLPDNGFKVDLAKHAVVRALTKAAA